MSTLFYANTASPEELRDLAALKAAEPINKVAT